MIQPITTIDFDRAVPDELLPLALAAAEAERADNLLTIEAAALTKKLWQPGRTLRFAFVDDHLPPDPRAQVHDQIKQFAGLWLEHANLHFTWDVPRREADIRIAFDPALGNWSYIGTDALAFQDCQITMNLGELATGPAEERTRHIILHEFGHALGLIHEHQGPSSIIEWNRPAVTEILSGPPNYWTDDQIEINIFMRYDSTHSQYQDLLPEGTDFDQDSIMIYEIPDSWTLGEQAVYATNSQLSEVDKAFIAQCYPAQHP